MKDALADRVAALAGPDRAGAARAFAEAYLRRSTVGYEDAAAVEQLAHEVLGAFGLAARRGSAPVIVRAFNPTLAEDGYEPPGSVVETSAEDMPFLVDSISCELAARGLGIHRVLYPIIGTERGPDGGILRVLHPREAPLRESMMHFELDRRLGEAELDELVQGARHVLDEVRTVVEDFALMRGRMGRLVELVRAAAEYHDAEDVDEAIAFLEWLPTDNFVFLGYREYELSGDAYGVVPGSGLGLLADDSRSRFAAPQPVGAVEAGLRDRALAGGLLTISKTNSFSPVHRRARMDYIGVRRVAADGTPVGEARLVGLFTSKAYAERASETPPLQPKLRRILEAEDLIVGSHDYKAALALFDAFPKDDLFATPADDLRRAIVALLELRGDEVRLLGRRAPDGRTVSLIVALPRERNAPGLAARLEELFREHFQAASVSEHLVLGEGDRAQIHFTVHRPDGGLPPAPFPDLQEQVAELARSWDERLKERLVARHDAARGRLLAQRWASRFPDSYKAATDPDVALADVECFERIGAGSDPFVVGLRSDADGSRPLTRIGLYTRGGNVELSSFMPILEALGLHVVEERPTRLLDDQHGLQDFGVLDRAGTPLDLDASGGRLAESIAAVFRGDAESDALNELVLAGGLDWRQVAVLRGLRKYRQRVGSRFTERYQNEVLVANAPLVALLVRLFELRFDPSHPVDPGAEAALRAEIHAALDAVEFLDHDRILRNHLGLVEAILRTNAYRPGRRALSFKLRSADVPAMPRPAPLYEIFVYSSHVEGIHLRGGRIARGGLRWSDRMDYRTEVFGLMRAQMTKNAVIVPTGAKGGFFVKQLPAEIAARAAEVERCYVDFVSGLLDVTDNLVGGQVAHPAGVRILDGDDTYLVVAADKGTARLSDTANAVAEAHGFWLGDAFASGGSAGYDHKKLGITARGAWESVKRHFRELGIDPARDAFTCVGIGDMSGDVFGNGMLLSDRLRLIAAYDHRHVFIDPAPDPAASFAERRRLFELAGSSWDDYDRAVLSEGAVIASRAAKRVELTPQVREALQIEDEALTPAELIQAMLRAPVDLLWNGGIGTVVKASEESDDDAQDRASDGIRVNAADLRCRVVGEGGNLGFTQRARIEYAQAGGAINADFIDNSAGVNCSDHEVNLKILLGVAEAHGRLTRSERDVLLEQVTDDVTVHVLAGSFLQAQVLAQEARISADRLFAYDDLVQALERDAGLDRELESLPSAEELTERGRLGRGLTRPELAVLLAFAKQSLTDDLLASALPDEPSLQALAESYYPPAVIEQFGDLLAEHPLRRELIATIAANDVVDSLGPTFVSRLVAERGAAAPEVVQACILARRTTGADARWNAVEGLETSASRDLVTELMAGIDELVEATTRRHIACRGDALSDAGEAARTAFDRLLASIDGLLPEAWREERAARRAELVDQGAPQDLAHVHVHRRELGLAPDVASVAAALGRELDDVARAFLLVDERARIWWLEAELGSRGAATRFERWAVGAIHDDLRIVRRAVATRALAEAPGIPADAAVAALLDRSQATVARLDDLLRSLELEGPDLAGLTLAVRRLQALAEIEPEPRPVPAVTA